MQALFHGTVPVLIWRDNPKEAEPRKAQAFLRK